MAALAQVAPALNLVPGFPDRCPKCGSLIGLDIPALGGAPRWYCGVGHSGTIGDPPGPIHLGNVGKATPRRNRCVGCGQSLGRYRKRCDECKKLRRRERDLGYERKC